MTDQPSVKLLPGERVLIEDIDGMLFLQPVVFGSVDGVEDNRYLLASPWTL